MAFMLPALASALGGLLFKKKGGKIAQQSTNAQAFMQAKPVALRWGGPVGPNRTWIPTGLPKKKGGKVPKKRKHRY